MSAAPGPTGPRGQPDEITDAEWIQFQMEDLKQTCCVCKVEKESMYATVMSVDKRVALCSRKCFLIHEQMKADAARQLKDTVKIGKKNEAAATKQGK